MQFTSRSGSRALSRDAGWALLGRADWPHIWTGCIRSKRRRGSETVSGNDDFFFRERLDSCVCSYNFVWWLMRIVKKAFGLKVWKEFWKARLHLLTSIYIHIYSMLIIKPTASLCHHFKAVICDFIWTLVLWSFPKSFCCFHAIVNNYWVSWYLRMTYSSLTQLSETKFGLKMIFSVS